MKIERHPLAWPEGWKRTPNYSRKRAQFRGAPSRNTYGRLVAGSLTVYAAMQRVLDELGRLHVHQDDVVISSNVPTRLDGLPRSNAPEPTDPGVAVYWVKAGAHKVIAVDHYDRVADNLAAIAATLEAMRAIERHGGAAILDRAFTGFAALPNPAKPETWRNVFGYAPWDVPKVDEVEKRYRAFAATAHPDKGGSHEAMSRLNAAREAARKELGFL